MDRNENNQLRNSIADRVHAEREYEAGHDDAQRFRAAYSDYLGTPEILDRTLRIDANLRDAGLPGNFQRFHEALRQACEQLGYPAPGRI